MSDYLEPYERAVAEHGVQLRSLLYYGEWAQRRRFETFGALAPLAGRTIADIGSGCGDLLAWMSAQDIAYARYLGIEAVEAFHAEGVARHAREGWRDAAFIRGDFVADEGLIARLVEAHGVDVVLFGGSLNTLSRAQLFAALERAWLALADRPGRVLTFNFLAAGSLAETDFERHDPVEIARWAHARTPLFAICRQHLGGHDATVAMITPAPQGAQEER